MTVAGLIPVLQMAIGPVVLISGVGLLILSLTNRLGRVIDRGRLLSYEMLDTSRPQHRNVEEQLRTLSRRARLLQRAIFLGVICVLFSAVLIITLFFIAALHIEAAWLISALFVGAMVSLIVSLIAFLQELHQALIAFHLEIKG